MINAKKDYKKTINKFWNRFNQKLNDKLRKLNKYNPKAFWKIIKNNKKELIKGVSFNDLFEHFRRLNEDTDDENITIDTSNPSNSQNLDMSVLNTNITEDEIIRIVKNFKNNKAPGIDGIANEYSKHSYGKIIKL